MHKDNQKVNQSPDSISTANSEFNSSDVKSFQPPPYQLNSNSIQLKNEEGNADVEDSQTHKAKGDDGLPNDLKSGIESLSGFSMDDVKVHRNSNKPASLQAHAFANGTDIHLGPGQEKHLPHEAWHVVQQKQGRVQANKQMKGKVNINDDKGLEKEADVMGEKAVSQKVPNNKQASLSSAKNSEAVLQNKRIKSQSTTNSAIQLKSIKVGKKKLANFKKAMNNKAFKAILQEYYIEHGQDRVNAIANQFFSTNTKETVSLEQFKIELEYDLGTKSIGNEELTLQEQYMTEYGWKRAADNPRPDIGDEGIQQLNLYRTMSVDDWKALNSGDHSVLDGGHIGDFKQALRYFLGSSSDSKVMVEFTLKKGSEKVLFGGRLALPKKAERTKKLETMATAMGDGDFPVCNTAEGTSASAIGIKSESEGEAGFSVGIGGGETASEFMGLVDTIALKSVGSNYSKEASAEGDDSRIEADANLLLNVNNCLINAISMAALNREATLEELIVIRGAMGNYGEMLLASPAVILEIRNALNIVRPITVIYQDGVVSEDFDGEGDDLLIYHVNGNHFTHEFE